MVSTVIGMFSLTLPVYDVSYINVNGEDILQPGASRTIDAAIDASSRKQLEQIFGQGAVSDGDIGIYTMGTLYQADHGQTGQSFVKYNGVQYKIVADNDWTGQAGCRVYLGRRHIVPELI
jgi:hypothetical protein